jgi:hypothetical protein
VIICIDTAVKTLYLAIIHLTIDINTALSFFVIAHAPLVVIVKFCPLLPNLFTASDQAVLLFAKAFL